MLLLVCGYRGSGKSTIGKIARKFGIPVYEMSDAVISEMKKKGMKIDNKSLRLYADELRKRKGNDVVAKIVAEQIKSSAVIVGVRSIKEKEVFSSLGEVKVLSVLSSERDRLERVMKRKKPSDPSTLEELRWADRIEDSWGLAELIKSADYKIINNSMDKFEEDVSNLLCTLFEVKRC